MAIISLKYATPMMQKVVGRYVVTQSVKLQEQRKNYFFVQAADLRCEFRCHHKMTDLCCHISEQILCMQYPNCNVLTFCRAKTVSVALGNITK